MHRAAHDISGAQASNGPDPKITLALRRAHRLLNWDEAGRPSASKAPTDPYERKLVRLALLAPDIQNQLLEQIPITPVHIRLRRRSWRILLA